MLGIPRPVAFHAPMDSLPTTAIFTVRHFLSFSPCHRGSMVTMRCRCKHPKDSHYREGSTEPCAEPHCQCSNYFEKAILKAIQSKILTLQKGLVQYPSKWTVRYAL